MSLLCKLHSVDKWWFWSYIFDFRKWSSIICFVNGWE